METQLDRGIIVPGPVINLALAGVANATAIVRISNFASQIGTKSFKIRKLMVRNNAGGNLWLALGTGAGGGFANALPPIRVMNNLDGEWQAFDLPAVEFFADFTAYPDALVGGGSLDIQAEVEEIG